MSYIAEDKSIDDLVKKLRKSDTEHKWLIYSKPGSGQNPKKIDIKDYEIKEEKENKQIHNLETYEELEKFAEERWF